GGPSVAMSRPCAGPRRARPWIPPVSAPTAEPPQGDHSMSRHATRPRPSIRPRLSKTRRPALRLDPLEDRTVPTAVALLPAENPSWVADVRDKLLATGQSTSVSEVDVRFGTPALADLEAYDGVLVWNDYAFADPVTLGNNLADYVDAGHGVVVATFANANSFF